MDGLSAAASVVAVIQISAQVFDLCRTYYLNVKDARKDIQRLRNEIASLQDILVNVADLANESNAASLQTLKLVNQDDGPLKQCHFELTALLARLKPEDGASKVKLALRSLKWPLNNKDVDKTLLAIGRYKSSFVLALSTDQAFLTLAVSRDVSDIKEQIETQKLDDNRQAVVDWLSTTDPSVNYHASCKKCQPETGRWLIDQKNFREWQEAPNSFLWLFGIPGSGKTILCSTIIQHFKQHVSTEPGNAVAYFYFDFNTAAKQQVSSCFSSLVGQLCAQVRTLPAFIRQVHSRCTKGNHQPSLTELMQMLASFDDGFDNVFIVIDALDECPKDGERGELLAAFSDIKSRSTHNFHFLVTSRREPDIETTLSDLVTSPAISLQGSHVDMDIHSHISHQLATDPKLKKWSLDIKKEIENALTTGANGMFRWVVCQLDALKRCLKVNMIHKALKNLPKTLDDTYSRLFLEIDEAYRQEAKNALCWLVFARRPLQLVELAEAIIINPRSDTPFNPEERFPDPQNVLEILSSLITTSSIEDQMSSDLELEDFQAWTTTVRLAHFSVKEYLISDRIKDSQARYFAIPDPMTHNVLAKCCLYYVLHYCYSKSKTRTRKDLYDFPLLEYASKWWYFHIDFLPAKLKHAFTPDVLKLLLSESALSCWLHVHAPGSPAKQPFEDDEVYDITPLCYASAMGLSNVVQALIALGHDPNIETFLPPLHRAVSGHSETIVNILLEAGAAVNMRDDYNSLTPLHHAAEEGTSPSMIENLIRYGGDVNAEDESGKTPLYLAVYLGNGPIARLLVENGAKVNIATTRAGQTPFHFAAYNDDVALSRYLIEHGANINAQNYRGQTALHYAASLNQQILHLLLEFGADLEVETNMGETPLYWAATGRNYELPTGMLVGAGANIVQPLLLLAKNGSRTHEGFHRLFCAGILHEETTSLAWSTLRECVLSGYYLCSDCRRMFSEHFGEKEVMNQALVIRNSKSMR